MRGTVRLSPVVVLLSLVVTLACRSGDGDNSIGDSGDANAGGDTQADATAGRPNQNTGGSGGGSGGDRIVDQLSTGDDACLGISLPVGKPGAANDGRLSCSIVDIGSETCDCTRVGRAVTKATTMDSVRVRLEEFGLCGESSRVKLGCETFCGCEVLQLPGTATDSNSPLHACQNDPVVDAELAGFCVIDVHRTDAVGQPAPLGDAELVSHCPESSARRIRFVGDNTPTSVFLVCDSSAAL